MTDGSQSRPEVWGYSRMKRCKCVVSVCLSVISFVLVYNLTPDHCTRWRQTLILGVGPGGYWRTEDTRVGPCPCQCCEDYSWTLTRCQHQKNYLKTLFKVSDSENIQCLQLKGSNITTSNHQESKSLILALRNVEWVWQVWWPAATTQYQCHSQQLEVNLTWPLPALRENHWLSFIINRRWNIKQELKRVSKCTSESSRGYNFLLVCERIK